MPKSLPLETMAEQWADYAATILTPIAVGETDRQYIETRRAFYAGAQTMLAMVSGISDRYGEDAACVKLSAIEVEFRCFQQDLINGRA